MRLKNTVAIITGGGSGIGQAIAQLFARQGARVVIADCRMEAAQQTVKQIIQTGGSALAIKADVSKEASVEAMIKTSLNHYGQIDILVNNAAIASGDDILTIEEDTWNQQFPRTWPWF